MLFSTGNATSSPYEINVSTMQVFENVKLRGTFGSKGEGQTEKQEAGDRCIRNLIVSSLHPLFLDDQTEKDQPGRKCIHKGSTQNFRRKE